MAEALRAAGEEGVVGESDYMPGRHLPLDMIGLSGRYLFPLQCSIPTARDINQSAFSEKIELWHMRAGIKRYVVEPV